MKGDEVGGPIRWRVHIPVPPDRVFTALDSDDGRAGFWAESATETEGHIEFRFVNGVNCRSRILERRRPHRFAIDYMGGPVRFDLSSDGMEGTDLQVTHEAVTSDDWNEVHAGWLNVLFPLKAWLAHGVDLRNHDPARLWEDGYVDQ